MPQVPQPRAMAAAKGATAQRNVLKHQIPTLQSRKEVMISDCFDPARRRTWCGRLAGLAVYGLAHLAGNPVPAARFPARCDYCRATNTPCRAWHRPRTYRPLAQSPIGGDALMAETSRTSTINLQEVN